MKKITLFFIVCVIGLVCITGCLDRKKTDKRDLNLDTIQLKSKPEAIFTSISSNKIVVLSDGKVDIYNNEGECYTLEENMDVSMAYPAQETFWVINDKQELYEISYDGSYISEVVLTNIQYITGYYDSYAAITTGGELYVWGDNINCRLGIEGIDYLDDPTLVKDINGVKKVVLGDKYSLLLTQNGYVYECGELCIENTEKNALETYQTEFVKIDRLSDVTDVFCGYGNIAVQEDGMIQYWVGGYCSVQTSPAVDVNTTEQSLNENLLVCYAEGPECMCALSDKGELFFWGTDSIYCKDIKAEGLFMYPRRISELGIVDEIYPGGYIRKGLTIYIISEN